MISWPVLPRDRATTLVRPEIARVSTPFGRTDMDGAHESSSSDRRDMVFSLRDRVEPEQRHRFRNEKQIRFSDFQNDVYRSTVGPGLLEYAAVPESLLRPRQQWPTKNRTRPETPFRV